MQNNKMLFFEVKPPCFEVFLGYEFIWLAFLYFPPPLSILSTVCVYIYSSVYANIHRTSETAFTAIRLDLDSSNKSNY